MAAFTVNTTADSALFTFTRVGDGQSGPPGAAVPQPAGVRVTLKSDGRPVIGARAYWNGSGVTRYTDAQGYAYFPFTFASSLGTKTYSVILYDATHEIGWVDLSYTTVAGPPANAVAPAGTFWLAGPGAAAGTHYTPTLDLTDASGNPTPGVTVTWQVVTGDGMVTQAQTTSDANGRVTNSYTLGSAGYQEIKVTIPGVGTRMFFAGTSPHTYTGHILPSTPDPLTVAVNGNLDVSIEVRDETGALYPNTQGLRWGWTTTPGTGSLGNYAYAGWFNRYLGQTAGTATIGVQIVPPQCHIAPCPPIDVPGLGTVTRNVIVQ
jgi:Bacterial Ig-like domain (group 1)